MNYELQKIARFNNGFDTRLLQLVVKSAVNGEFSKEAGWGDAAAGIFARYAPRIEQTAARMAPRIEGAGAAAPHWNIAGGIGRHIGQLPKYIAAVPFIPGRWLGNTTTRLVGGAVEGAASMFGPKARVWGQAANQNINRFMTGNIKFGPPKPGESAANIASGATAAARGGMGGGAAGGGGAAAGAGGGSAGGGGVPWGGGAAGGAAGSKTPGFMTNEQLAELGLVTPNRGFTMPGRGLVGPGVDPSILGDPTKGLLGRISGMLPQGAQNWISANPNAASAAGGALAGGGLMYAGNEYGDYKRRQALANLGMLDRLGLAFQLATNPQGFSNTLRL